MTITEIGQKAIEIIDEHAMGAEMDAGFDGGEFSGPAHCRQAMKRIEKLAKENNVSLESLMEEIDRQTWN